MPDIKDRFQFEPNANARRAWLSTRKKPITCGNQSLPGFYQTVDYEKDFGWVMLAACVESAAVILTIYGGFIKGGPYIIGSIIVVLLFLVFDIVGANFVHRNVAKKCEIKSRILFTSDNGAKQGLRNELKKGNGIVVLGILLIVISSVLKISAILLLGKFALLFYIVMSVLYLLVIYVHIAHTGYYLAERRTGIMFREQHELWAQDKMMHKENKVEEGNIRFSIRKPAPSSILESEVKLNIVDKKSVGEHSISFIKEEQKGDKKLFIYEIETNGLLKDDDINLFTNAQTDIQAGIIALACLKHQVEKVHA